MSPRVAVATLFFVNGLMFGTVIPRLPEFQAVLGISKAGLGIALLGLAGGSICAFPFAARFIRQLGSAPVAWIPAVLMIAGVVPLAFAFNPVAFFLALLAIGIGNGFMDVAMNMQAVEAEKRARRSFISQMHGFWSVGGVAGAAVVALMTATGIGFVAHFIAFAVLGVVLVFSVKNHLVPTPPRSGSNSGPNSNKEPGSNKRWAWPSKALLVIGLTGMCSALAEAVTMDWSAVYLAEFMPVGSPVTVSGFVAFSTAMVIGRFSGDALIERFPLRTMVLASGGLVLAGYLLILIHPVLPAFITGYALTGFGLSVLAPLMYGAGARDTTRPPGTGLALVTGMGYSGFVIGAPLIGFLAEATSLRLSLWSIVVLMLFLIALATRLTSTKD